MFKKFQSDLLIKNPLIWNTRIIPLSILLVIFNLIFFLVGYNHGIIDFQSRQDYYYDSFEPIVIIFSILTSLLVFISWSIFYFKNNAFKSFYPKSNRSIFKEWLLILVICSLNFAYLPTYFFANDLCARNYFEKSEFIKRCETLSKASIFLDNSFEEGYYIDSKDEYGNWKQVYRDSFDYNNRKYSLKSLINKSYTSFTIFDDQKDSINIQQVKKWMIDNQKDSIKKLMIDYFKIINEHEVITNINSEQWFNLVYDYPEFTNYIKIGKKISADENYYENNYDQDYNEVVPVYNDSVTNSDQVKPFDSLSFTSKYEKGNYNFYYKYYINSKPIENSYEDISKAWTRPDVDLEFLIVFSYIALGFSLLFFSFKVTSGKSWLISLITSIILGIIIGILSSFSLTFIAGIGVVITIIIALIAYLSIVLIKNQNKKISTVIFNLVLWYFPVLPITIYFFIIEILKINQGYYDVTFDNRTYENFPLIENLLSFTTYFFVINIVLSLIVMYFISKTIRKWKGIAES